MSALVLVLLAAAGGIGSACRLFVDGLIRSRTRGNYPIGTTVVNITGSLLLGVIVGLTGRVLPEEWHLILGIGFLGGYTTFSTASFETVRLIQERRFGAGLLNGVGMLVAAIAASALGLWLGTLL